MSPNDRQADDPLAAFGPETGSPAEGRSVAYSPAPAARTAPSPIGASPASAGFTKSPAVVSPIEVLGAPSPKGTISLDQVVAIGGLALVEGVAVVQALSDGIVAAGGGESMPVLSGAFLDSSGDVVVNGAFSSDPAPRELARLLHEIVLPDSMPPAARLFIGRWTNNDSTDLAAFASELAYFARPNGREIASAVYARSSSTPVTFTNAPPQRHNVEPPPKPKAKPEQAERRPDQVQAWLRAHRNELLAATAALAVVLVVGLVAWFWPASMWATSNRAWASTDVEETTAPDGTAGAKSTKNTRTRVTRTPAGRPSDAATDAPIDGRESLLSQSALEAPLGPAGDDSSAAIAEATSVSSARSLPDMRIYSGSDAGVEPPRLRSAEIPQTIIAGFPKRTNSVELLIDERGGVQTARMIGEPQRMPDIMLLSRMKELQFEPASRNGTPVRYKMILTWNVTP